MSDSRKLGSPRPQDDSQPDTPRGKSGKKGKTAQEIAEELKRAAEQAAVTSTTTSAPVVQDEEGEEAEEEVKLPTSESTTITTSFSEHAQEGGKEKEKKEDEGKKIELPLTSEKPSQLLLSKEEAFECAAKVILERYLAPSNKENQKTDATREERLKKLNQSDLAKYNRRSEQMNTLRMDLEYAMNQWDPTKSEMKELLKLEAMNGAILMMSGLIYSNEYSKRGIEAVTEITFIELGKLTEQLGEIEKVRCKETFKDMSTSRMKALEAEKEAAKKDNPSRCSLIM